MLHLASQPSDLPKAVKVLILFLLFAEVVIAKPYANYGFYSPYPPPKNQVIYHFSPLDEDPASHLDESSGDGRGGNDARSREQRDLSWRDDLEDFLAGASDDFDLSKLDSFLDGTDEPSCQELRQLWELAKHVQRKSVLKEKQTKLERSPEDPKELIKDVFAYAPIKNTKDQDEKEPFPNEIEDDVKADRRRMSTPNQLIQLRGSSRNQETFDDGKDIREGKTKDIFGIVHDRPSETEVRKNHQRVVDPTLAVVHTHPSEHQEQEPSYFDLLANEIYGQNFRSREPQIHTSVIHQSPETQQRQQTAFDRIRAELEAERDDQGGDEGEDPFEAIRQKLMNSRTSSSSLKSSARSLRRKNANQRRRHIRETTADLPFALDSEPPQELSRLTVPISPDMTNAALAQDALRRYLLEYQERKRKMARAERRRKKLERRRQRALRRRLRIQKLKEKLKQLEQKEKEAKQ